MFYTHITLLVTFLLDLVLVRAKDERDKDLKILVLRQQFRLLQRRVEHTLRCSRFES